MQTDKTALNFASPPAQTSAQEWRQSLSAWGRAALAALLPFLLTRLLLVLLTFFTVVASQPASSTFSPEPNTLFYSWFRWDATRYLQIATEGYLQIEQTAYFPLYPTLVQVVQRVLRTDLLLTGMLISNVAFYAALVALYRFVIEEFDAETARRSLLYLATFPTAFCFFAAYGETLFLLLLILTFYTLRRGKWWLAGLLGGLAALSNAAGCLLFLIFLCEFVRQQLPILREAQMRDRTRALQRFIPLTASLLILLGVGVYIYALTQQFGNPLAFLKLADGSNRLHLPWSALQITFQHLSTGSLLTFADIHSIFSLLLLAFLLIALVFSFIGPVRLNKQQWSLIVFTLAMMFYTLCLPGIPGRAYNINDPLPSILLTTPLTFPAIIVFARLGRYSWFNQIYLLITLPLFSFLVIQLLLNRWAT